MTLFLLSDDPSAGLSFKLAGFARSLGLRPLAGLTLPQAGSSRNRKIENNSYFSVA